MNFEFELTINANRQKLSLNAESLYWALNQIALDNEFLKKTPEKLTITLLASAEACKLCKKKLNPEWDTGPYCLKCEDIVAEANEAKAELYLQEDYVR